MFASRTLDNISAGIDTHADPLIPTRLFGCIVDEIFMPSASESISVIYNSRIQRKILSIFPVAAVVDHKCRVALFDEKFQKFIVDRIGTVGKNENGFIRRLFLVACEYAENSHPAVSRFSA